MKIMAKRFAGWTGLMWGILLWLTGNASGESPLIVIPPASQAVPQGCNAYLNVSMSGDLPITYIWHRNFEFTNYYQVTLNSTNCTLVLTNLAPSDACFFNFQAENIDGYSSGAQAVVAVISSGMATNGFQLTIQGLTNSAWTINYKTNLAEADWMPLTNFGIPASPPVFTYVDLAATNLNRFYQVIPTVY